LGPVDRLPGVVEVDGILVANNIAIEMAADACVARLPAEALIASLHIPTGASRGRARQSRA